MAAKVDTKFSRGFFLTEEALTKIEELTRVRLGHADDYSQKYDVHRVDDAVVTYDRAADVIASEENSKRNAVKGLDFEATGSLGSVSLSFERGEKSTLIIESVDRDRALLLSSDMKEYLKSEVLIKRFAVVSGFMQSRVAFPLILMLTFLPIMIFSLWISSPEPLVGYATDSQKLDYLYRASLARKDMDAFPAYMLAWVFIVPIALIILSSTSVYPAYTFYWGKEKNRYDTAKSIRDKILWGVIVALVIGVFASIIYGRLPRLSV